MTDTNNPSFAAIITITSPESDEQVRLRVMLLPADLVPLENGLTKPLQDCTLAELQQFADSLEKRLWDQHSSATLIDLAVGGQAEISFSFESDEAAASQSMDLWLAHAIVFPDGDTPQPAALDEAEDERAILDQDPVPAIADGLQAVEQELTDQEVEPAAIIDDGALLPDEEIDTDVEEPAAEIMPAAEEIATDLPAEITEDGAETKTPEEETAPVKEESEAPDAPPTPPETPTPDVRVLGLRRPLHHATWTAVDILANESAFRNAQAHSLTSLDREVAGVLIGPQPEKQPDGRYLVHIIDTIIAKYTRMHGASVTYTPESWRYINDKLAERYPDESAVIVGWYHTHPGFGIFLSGMDLFIHQNFFTQKWHIALVLDPRARSSGFFCWDRQMTNVAAYDFPWPKWASGSW